MDTPDAPAAENTIAEAAAAADGAPAAAVSPPAAEAPSALAPAPALPVYATQPVQVEHGPDEAPPVHGDTPEEKLTEVVNLWLADSAANSPLSRATEAWNHLLKVLPDLKARILKELATNG